MPRYEPGMAGLEARPLPLCYAIQRDLFGSNESNLVSEKINQKRFDFFSSRNSSAVFLNELTGVRANMIYPSRVGIEEKEKNFSGPQSCIEPIFVPKKSARSKISADLVKWHWYRRVGLKFYSWTEMLRGHH